MLFEILVVLASSTVSGAAIALLITWNYHRRTQAIEEYLKVREVAVNDRLNQVEKIATREMKSDAAKVRWSKKEMEEHSLVKNLATVPVQSSLEPWDPRTWGGS